ncbi:MAG: alcohol dehydrogenase catalytic domain-containing protein [Armatimonadetes bacterium]|nr:alcohol dehydrogenase catalytic domain-containing protein [Armatimonadota bacterium]
MPTSFRLPAGRVRHRRGYHRSAAKPAGVKALVADGGLRFVPSYPTPVPGRGEALVRVRLAGVCGTDLELLGGYHGFRGVPGHELVGDVAAGPRRWLGRRVTAAINVGCGRCPVCRASGPEHCPARSVAGILGRDGAFAEYVAVPVRNLHRVPERVSDEAAVFAEPLAAALRVRDQLAVRTSDRVAVLGPGRLGLLVGLVTALDGTAVTLLGRPGPSLANAAKLGLPATEAADERDSAYDVVVDCTGDPAGLAEAIRLTRPRGTLVLKTTYHGERGVNASAVVVKELTLVGSRCGPIAPALRLVAAGRVPVGRLGEAVYPLEDGLAAFEHAGRPGALKVLLRP